MLRINLVLFLLLAVFYLIGIAVFPFETNSRGVQHQIFLLTGIASWLLWAEALVIASRPKSIERIAGEPLDRLMQCHRQLGWGMAAAGALHAAAPLIVMALPIEQVSGMAERPVIRNAAEAVWIWLHPIAALLGIVLTLFMLRVIYSDASHALGFRSWDKWERTHRAWAWLFLLFIPHSLRLMKETEMIMPLGFFNLAVTAVGAWAAVRILRHRPGIDLRREASVERIERLGSEAIVTLRSPLAAKARAGQFFYLSLPGDRCDPHPFTLMRADAAKGTLAFWVKTVGGWTERLAALGRGSAVFAEGPWGTFLPVLDAPGAQVWIAGGLGLAPFIPWLEAAAERREGGGSIPRVTLWWFVHERSGEPMLPAVENLARRAGAALRVFETGPEHRRADPKDVLGGRPERVEVCGSRAFAEAFRAHWKALGAGGLYRSEAC